MSEPAALRQTLAQLSIAATLTLSGLSPGVAQAQTGGSITGTVTAETGIALSGADVGIVGSTVRSTTDEHNDGVIDSARWNEADAAGDVVTTFIDEDEASSC